MRGLRCLLLCFALLSWLCGCGEDAAETVGSHHHVARTSGGAVVLSYDERIAVVTNRSAGIVTIVTLKPERGLRELVTKTHAISVGADSEPWAAVIGADDNTAFVVLRKAKKLIRVDDLRGSPTVAAQDISVGSEPMSLAISPTGKMLFVANWGEGTISKIDVPNFRFLRDLDVNASLVDMGLLGDIQPRAGLAHPRALAITDNGDQNDDDETLFATEFFSQPMRDATRAVDAVDRNRVGLVYSWTFSNGQPGTTVELSPVQDTGFPDSKGKQTGCFPNQLYAAAIDNGRLYVTAMCTSPRGPLDKDGDSAANFKTLLHPAVFAIDLKMREELPEQGRLLTQVLQAQYDAAGDIADARMPLIPNDLAFRPGQNGERDAFVLALGADAIFRLSYDAQGTLQRIGSTEHPFIAPLPDHGNSVGLAVTRRSSPAFGLSLSDVTQELSILDLASESVLENARVLMTGDDPQARIIRESPANEGRGLFATGRGVWSHKGQAWSSCESCHPGGLSDGVVWYFSRGPRRSLSAASTYQKDAPEGQEPLQRLLLWGANVDEVQDVEVIARTVSGGVGAVVWQYVAIDDPSNDCRIVYDGKPLAAGSGNALCNQAKPASILRNGLNGSLAPVVNGQGCGPTDASCDSSINEDWNRIDAFIRSLRAPRPPAQVDLDRVAAGRELFVQGRCASCHGGPLWTVSTRFYRTGSDANGEAPVVPIIPVPAPPTDFSAALGKLRKLTYSVPKGYAKLNPTAQLGGDCVDDNPCATYRVSPADGTPDTAANLLYGNTKGTQDPRGDAAKNAALDQIRCVLRNVGTFPTQPVAPPAPAAPPPSNYDGIVPFGAPAPLEYRSDMSTLAQGKDGFAPPSLLGLIAGAPYFHAGNARTLEEVFDARFKDHHNNEALGVPADFLSEPMDVQYLIEFLLSLDEATAPEEIPADANFCSAWPNPP